jgi:hypothetical protein
VPDSLNRIVPKKTCRSRLKEDSLDFMEPKIENFSLNRAFSKSVISVTPGKCSRLFVCSLLVILTLVWLGVPAVFAENGESTNAVSYAITSAGDSPLELFSKHESAAQEPQKPQKEGDHLQTIQNSFQQFFHWQYLLRLFLGFALAVAYSWFISWSPRRSVGADPAANIEDGKTLILLGMLGAVVAEITRISPNMAFVIFGIGSLVRFRTAMDDPKLTGKAIIVVVIGLACGMNQWALGGFVTVAAWVLIYFLESHASVRLKIRISGKHDVRAVYGDVQDFLRNNRCRVKAANLTESKRSMMFVAQVPAELNASEMETVLRTKLAKVGEDCEISVRHY